MNGDFLNNLYMLGGLFVATTTVVWLFTAANQRAAQRESDNLRRDIRRDIRRVEKGVRRVSKDVRRVSKDVRRVDKDVRRVDKGVRQEIRRVDKRLSGEIGKTNREVRKTRKEVWWLRVDMEVVKDRLNIGTVSRPDDPLPVASDPEAASLASPAPVADPPAPESADADSVVPVPVAAEPEPASSEMSDPAVGDLGDSGAVASESGSVGSAPAADIPGVDVGSEAVARRPGRAGVGPSGIPAPAAAEK